MWHRSERKGTKIDYMEKKSNTNISKIQSSPLEKSHILVISEVPFVKNIHTKNTPPKLNKEETVYTYSLSW